MAPEDFHLPLKKNLLKCRVALALMVFLVIPASLSMALFFLGSDGHYPLDGFPRNESGVGFLGVIIGQEGRTERYPPGCNTWRCFT